MQAYDEILYICLDRNASFFLYLIIEATITDVPVYYPKLPMQHQISLFFPRIETLCKTKPVHCFVSVFFLCH